MIVMLLFSSVVTGYSMTVQESCVTALTRDLVPQDGLSWRDTEKKNAETQETSALFAEGRVVTQAGFEPATPSSEGWCQTRKKQLISGRLSKRCARRAFRMMARFPRSDRLL